MTLPYSKEDLLVRRGADHTQKELQQLHCWNCAAFGVFSISALLAFMQFLT